MRNIGLECQVAERRGAISSGVARESGAAQNPGNLGIGRCRKSEDVDFFGTEQSALRYAGQPTDRLAITRVGQCCRRLGLDR